MIYNKDITLVFQGSITSWTNQAISNAKKYFTGSTIILSTWEGQDINGIECEVILSKDPGSYLCSHKSQYGDIYTNINRQLISTKHGIKNIETKFCFKLRSDLLIGSNSILKYFDIFTARNKKYSFFERRILVNTLTSKLYSDTGNFLPTPFHVSDWFYFGLTSDVKYFFSLIPIIEDEETFSQYTLKYIDKNPCPHLSFRYAPEQYFCYTAFSSLFNICFDDWSDFNEQNITMSENLIIDNFVFLDFIQHKIFTPKYIDLIHSNNGIMFTFNGYMNFDYFCNLYRNKYLNNEKLFNVIYFILILVKQKIKKLYIYFYYILKNRILYTIYLLIKKLWLKYT
jgi:hypothetical protein